jgi:hypothetical protein
MAIIFLVMTADTQGKHNGGAIRWAAAAKPHTTLEG